MKKISLLLLFVMILTGMTPAKRKKVIFFGDSITQMGVNAGGYIDQVQKALEKNNDQRYELTGAGIGGNKVYDLYLRLEEDVLEKKPDIVFIYIGINDVWHKTSGIGTDIEKYERFYVAIIKKLQARKVKVVLCTPSVIGEKKNGANPQDKDLDAYAAVIRRLAQTYTCALADLRAAFIAYENANNTTDSESGILTTDRVHLNEKGNGLVAAEVLKVLQ